MSFESLRNLSVIVHSPFPPRVSRPFLLSPPAIPWILSDGVLHGPAAASQKRELFLTILILYSAAVLSGVV